MFPVTTGPYLDSTDPTTKITWGLKRLGIRKCWQRGFTGTGVRIGHLDTGVDGSHSALSGRIAEFMEFDFDGFPVPRAEAKDSGSHGTHIAGVICGKSWDNTSIGVAPAAELCSGMVIEGGKTIVRILAGLDWMFDCKVRVLCFSLGIPIYNPLFEIILRRIRMAGVLVIAPAGNRGYGRTCSPANYPGVLAVGAMNAKDKVARFSGSQIFKRATDFHKPNLVAPGVDIPSANPGGGLQIRSGTSMAAAHVAGVAAILFQAKPDATPEEVQEAIQLTCTPLLDSSERRSGKGLVNPVKALEVMLSSKRSKAGWRPTSTSD